MAAKRPTGERPKQLSKQAKKYADNPVYLTGNKYNKLVPPSEAAAAAGKKRDFEKSFGATVDPRKKKSPKPAKPSTVQQIATRFNVTAREARDIAKAVGNVVESARASRGYTASQGKRALKASVKDLKKQVKETGRAAKSGVTGTRSAKLYYDIDTGAPEGVVGKPRPKYGKKNDQRYPGGSFTK
jgi:hypothetical protein